MEVTAPKLGLCLWFCSASVSWPLLCRLLCRMVRLPWCQIWENVCPYEEGWSACAGNWFTGCNSVCVRELEVYKRTGNVCSIASACCWALAKTKDFWVGNIILSKGVTQKSFHCKLVSEVRWKNVWTLYIMFWNILVGDLFLEAKQNSNKNCRQLGLT